MSTSEQPPGESPAEAAPETVVVPPTAAQPPPAAPPAATWPPGWTPAQPPPPRRHSAWITTMTPLTAGILGLVLVLAGFGIGVVVGWQHDGHGTQRVMFGPERRGGPNQQMGPGQRQFGPYFDGPGQQRRDGQQGQQGPQGPQQQGQANPTPSPSS